MNLKGKKIGILLPDGVGMRNFIFGALPEILLKEGAEVMVLHFLPEGIEKELGEPYQSWTWKRLDDHPEGIKNLLLRQAKVFGQLYGRLKEDNSQVVFDMQFRHGPKSWKGKLMSAVVHRMARWNKHPEDLKKLDSKHKANVRKQPSVGFYQSQLKEWGVDLLFCTHQRASKAVPVIEAAQLMGIPTSTFIYSWDNLPKGRMAVMPDHYLVWSSFMKEQLMTYYPELEESRIHLVGTPQFEPYFRPEFVMSKETFFQSLGLDPNKPLICYSGDDETTSPFDEFYLRDLAKAMRSIPEEKRPQILFRACPVDHSGRFDWVLKEYPEIVSRPPLWKNFGGNWTQILPTPEDLKMLVNVTLHSDAVMNVASTMCFDFALFDKPGIFVRYNQNETKPHEPHFNLVRGYDFPHFKVVHELQPIHWLNGADEIVAVVEHVLNHPKEKSEARKAWVEQMLDGKAEGASLRLVEAFKTMLYA